MRRRKMKEMIQTVRPEYELIDVEGDDSTLVFIKETDKGYEAYSAPLEHVGIFIGDDKQSVVDRAAGVVSEYFDKYS